MMKRQPATEGLALSDQEAGTVDRKHAILNPVAAMRGALASREMARGETLGELAIRVTEKLLTGIAQEGTVSLVHDKATGDLTDELYTAYFASPEIPRLRVMLWRKHVCDADVDTHERLFGVKPARVFIQAIDEDTRKSISVTNRWGTPENQYDISYRRSAEHEAANQLVPRTVKEKIEFLRQIAATEVNEPAIAQHFGRTYTPGDTRSAPILDDVPTVQSTYWVRDIRHQLPALSPAFGETPEHTL